MKYIKAAHVYQNCSYVYIYATNKQTKIFKKVPDVHAFILRVLKALESNNVCRSNPETIKVIT